MNNIITITREFGSGGREVAKRLAEELGYKYYDKEIIAEIAKRGAVSESYVDSINKVGSDDFPYLISRSFSLYTQPQKQATDILVLQRKVIKEIAESGNAVIVGRAADIILRGYNTFNIFVYADIDSKIKRCKSRMEAEENLTEKDILKKIKEIDKSRKRHALLLGSDSWGRKENYNLCINTSGIEIKNIVPVLAKFAKEWFKEKK